MYHKGDIMRITNLRTVSEFDDKMWYNYKYSVCILWIAEIYLL